MMLPLLPIQYTCLLLGPTPTTPSLASDCCKMPQSLPAEHGCLLFDPCPALWGQGRACCEQLHLLPTYNPHAP